MSRQKFTWLLAAVGVLGAATAAAVIGMQSSDGSGSSAREVAGPAAGPPKSVASKTPPPSAATGHSSAFGPRRAPGERSVGTQTVVQSGALLEGLIIEGCLDVRADDVTVRDSVIRCSRPSGAAVRNYGINLVIDHVEIDGMDVTGSCVAPNHYTVRNSHVHSCADGLRANGNVVIRDSLVHQLARSPQSHNDAIQTTQGSGILVEGNTLVAYDKASGDRMNAVYIIAEDQGPVSDVVVRRNRVDGGGYSFWVGPGVDDVVFEGNVIGRNHRYGVIRDRGPSTRWLNNVWADTGAPVTPTAPSGAS